MPTPSPASAAPPTRPGRVALLMALVWLGYVLSLQIRNPRLIPSWHGFLHSAIALECGASGWVPENPFFAGEPLHYYWVYHCVGRGLASGLGVNPLVALWLLSLSGLVFLVVAAVWLGNRALGSPWAGGIAATFALAAANPFGPLIAGAKHVLRGVPLFGTPSGANFETIFVSNQLADRLMSRPLLPALYFSADWRVGQNVVWSFDISSRGLALGGIMALLAVWVAAEKRVSRYAGLVLLTALVTALNPIVGLAVAGLLGTAAVVVALVRRSGLRAALADACALGAGIVLALPTLLQLFGNGGTATLTPPGRWPLNLLVSGANLALLGPLAALGACRARRAGVERVVPVAVAGLGLVALYVGLHLEEGNEHNLLNATQVLLAVPAVIPLVRRRDGAVRPPRVARRAMLGAALAVAPMAAATWLAFDGRPSLPLDLRHAALRRLPPDGPVVRLEQWLRDMTPGKAVLLADPDRPVKMSGNVSELPALTDRALFIDQPSYLTRPYPEVRAREALARRAVAGDALAPEEWVLLRGLGRPVFLISWEADDALRQARLAERYGPPIFRDGFVAVFAMVPVSREAEAATRKSVDLPQAHFEH